MRWSIHSYEGAGRLRFGMAPEEAVEIVGQPFRTHTSRLTGLVLEMREPEYPDLSYDDAGLIELSFTPRVDAVFDGENEVFAVSPIDYIEALMAADPDLLISFGMIISYRRGISLNGFHTDDEPRRLGMFRQGHLQNVREHEMTKPFVWP